MTFIPSVRLFPLCFRAWITHPQYPSHGVNGKLRDRKFDKNDHRSQALQKAAYMNKCID
jgi:hypothetical protein